MKVIDSFTKEYSWLSNFEPFEKPFNYDGFDYPSVEHFYHACKFERIAIKLEIAKHPPKGLKSFVRKFKLDIPNWSNLRLHYMMVGLRYKFSKHNPKLRAKLIATGNTELIEGNWWKDTFWGVCNGVGENHLGKMLMEIRKQIITEENYRRK